MCYDQHMLSTMTAMQKVAVFCFHRDRLLVIHHPLAGLQVPAGTIEPDEAPLAAATRELREETGLVVPDLELVQSFLRVRDDGVAHTLEDIALADHTIPRGHRVEVTQVIEGVASFDYVTRDYTHDPPRIVSSVPGTASSDALSLRTERHLFRAELPDVPESSWWCDADGHRWRCSFEPVADVRLFMKQQDWLQRVL